MKLVLEKFWEGDWGCGGTDYIPVEWESAEALYCYIMDARDQLKAEWDLFYEAYRKLRRVNPADVIPEYPKTDQIVIGSNSYRYSDFDDFNIYTIDEWFQRNA